jgi:hypothetical protein
MALLKVWEKRGLQFKLSTNRNPCAAFMTFERQRLA